MTHKKKKHIIKTYHWEKGLLKVIEHEVEEFEAAVKRAINIACHMFKILDDDGVVVREGLGGNYCSHNHEDHHNPY